MQITMKLNMYKFTFFLLALSCYAQAGNLLTIGDTKVSSEEFKYIFLKNNADTPISKKSIQEYLDLYVNFKLKVTDAKHMGLDTAKTFIDELAKYRSQLTKPYLTDLELDENLTKEAYNRLKEEVEVSHILISTEKSVTIAKAKADSIKLAIDNGADFEALAIKYSDDRSVVDNKGYLGFIRGFKTVYSFETAAYNTPVGTISKPVKSRFGYHIIKVISRRDDPGELLVGHILKLTPEGGSMSELEQKKEEIEEIFGELLNGANFEDLAVKYSDDSYSAKNKGRLPWFGSGQIIKPFEDAAYALKVGEYSTPIQTTYGYHIIKLIDKRSLGNFEEMKPEIKRKMTSDDRGLAGVNAKIAQLKDEYKFKKFEDNYQALLPVVKKYRYADSMFLSSTSQMLKPVFVLAGINYTQADFGVWMNAHPKSDPSNIIGMDRKYKKYEKETILSYEDTQLEAKYPEFKNIINEYHDGILLFDVSSKKVWNKASEDVALLEKYYSKHKKNYRWEEIAWKGRILHCRSDSSKDLALKYASSSTTEELLKLVNVNGPNLKITEGTFKKGDNNAVDALAFETDELKNFEEYPVVTLDGNYLKEGSIKEFNYTKGAVTSDYQDKLEKNWIASLKKKTKVIIDKKELKLLTNELISK